MNKVRKKFIIYAMAAVFVLLTALLAVINVINFSAVADDADRITASIVRAGGELGRDEAPFRKDERGDMRRRDAAIGPESPELPFSARYFTVKFTPEGNGEIVSFNISAYTEEEAITTASSLAKRGGCGFVDTYYRYRVTKENGETVVTVIDQSRELAPSYRILKISAVGEAICLAVCLAFLIFISRRLFKPIEDADRREKQFLAEAEREFMVPLTVIGANAEAIERTHGPDERTQSINRQVKKMTEITKKIGALTVFPVGEERCDLSAIAAGIADSASHGFAEAGVAFGSDIDAGVVVTGDSVSLRKAVRETLDNAAKFAKERAFVSLKEEGGRVSLTVSNGTTLPDGNYDRAFDRFTRFENAAGVEGDGLGLSFVKDIVKAHNGRLSAAVENGVFILRITL